MVKKINDIKKILPSVVEYPDILKSEKRKTPIKKTNQQTSFIIQLEKEINPPPQKIQNLKKQTDKQSQTFVRKASLYTTVSLLHYWCNNDITSKDDDNNFRLIVKDLLKSKNPGFFSIRKAMKKYFPQLSTIKMFFFILFIGWIPKLYIQDSIDKILKYSREKGDNLPLLGTKILGTMNTYLANYNRTIQRFRDDKNNPIGDINIYVRKELHKPELLGYLSINHLHKNFAKTISQETSPSFRPFSNSIKKILWLNFEFFKNSFIRKIFLPFTFMIGIIPYFIAKFIEYFPNKMIKKIHSSIFMSTVIKKILTAISHLDFSYAINKFLCDIISDLLNEMNKRPEDKDIDEDIPNVVNESLSKDIKKFSELVYTLLTNEPYKTQENLEYLKNHGPDPKSNLERLLKMITFKGVIDRKWIFPTFVDALHLNIIDAFNFLFSKPEKLEEHLCNLVELLNQVFDYVPNTNTKEGKALSDDKINKQLKRKELVNEIIEKGVNLATEDRLNQSFNMLSRHQTENLHVSYRKIQKRANDRLPEIKQNVNNILYSYIHLEPTLLQTRNAKEDIEQTMRNIKGLFVLVSNAMSNENGPVKRQMLKHLRSFLENEEVLKDSIIKINRLNNKKEGLHLLKKELENLKITLKSQQNYSEQIELIKQHLLKLNNINKNHQFDSIISKYKKLEDQLQKIETHILFANKLQEMLKTTFFSNNLIYNLAKAQKEYLLNPNTKEKNLTKATNQMFEFLKQLDGFGCTDDTNVIKLSIRKILEAKNSKQLNEVYKQALSIVRRKIAKHKSLYQDEQEILPNYFDNHMIIIDKHLFDFPQLIKEIQKELIKQAKILNITVDKMQKLSSDIGKPSNIYLYTTLDTTTIVKTAISIFGFLNGYLGYFLGKTASIGLGSLALSSIFLNPVEGIKKLAIVGLKKLANSIAIPLTRTFAESTYNIITKNQIFYEGLIHAYMRNFIDHVKNTKG